MTIRNARAAIAAEVTKLLEAGTWQAVPVHQGLLTIRWTKTSPTPAYAREGKGAPYPFEDYDQHVFLTFIGQKIVMRTCPCPWVRCSDTQPPLWLVLAILQDVELAFDTQRQLDMRHERRGGRSGDGVRR
jgi:hypothetical protein